MVPIKEKNEQGERDGKNEVNGGQLTKLSTYCTSQQQTLSSTKWLMALSVVALAILIFAHYSLRYFSPL